MMSMRTPPGIRSADLSREGARAAAEIRDTQVWAISPEIAKIVGNRLPMGQGFRVSLGEKTIEHPDRMGIEVTDPLPCQQFAIVQAKRVPNPVHLSPERLNIQP